MEVTFQGSLKSFRLPQILTFLHRNQTTGTLSLTGPAGDVYLYFDSGSVVFATSNQEKFRLSAVLLRKNRLDAFQWKRIEEAMLQRREKFGKLAVEEGILTERELNDFLKIQVSEVLYGCFQWDEGKFSFMDVMHLPDYAVTISLSLTSLIMEGARRINEMRHFHRLFPRKTMVLRAAESADTQQQIVLTLGEWKILFLVDGKRTLGEICKESQEDELQVYRVVYGLLANQIVEVVSEDEVLVSKMHEAKEGLREMQIAVLPTRRIADDAQLLTSPGANLGYKDVLRVTLARLTVKNGEAADQIFPLIEQEYFIGRQLGNQIRISDPSISNVHARVFKGPEGYVLEDLNSRNGTYINEIRIGRKLLRENDSVRVGNTQLLYHIFYEVKRAPL